MFADKNPWMKGVQKLAAEVAAARKPVAAGQSVSGAANTDVRTRSPPAWTPIAWCGTRLPNRCSSLSMARRVVQALLGLNATATCGPLPPVRRPKKLAARQAQAEAYAAMLGTGGFDEALTRAVLYVMAAERTLDQRCALALNVARQQLMHLSLAAIQSCWCGTSSLCCSSSPTARSRRWRRWCPTPRTREGLAGAGERDRRRRRCSARRRTRSPGARGDGARNVAEKRVGGCRVGRGTAAAAGSDAARQP